MQLPDVNNGKSAKEIHGHYDQLFRAFYHIRPRFDDSSLSTVLYDSVGLVDVAEAVGSIEAISETVDIALMRQGVILFQSIAVNPSSWSDLAFRIGSPVIFKEAIIHLVGQWLSMSTEGKFRLRAEVANICERKFVELQSKKKAIEIRILSHYPAALKPPADTRPNRPLYATDIYMWISLSLFRQWFGQAMCEERGRNGKDGGAHLYRQLGTGGYSYLDRHAMGRFHEHFPMTPKGVSCLELSISNLKEQIKPFVQDLLVNNSQLDIEKEPVPYLTCCEVKKADLPWEKTTHVEEQEGSLRRLLPQTVPKVEDEEDKLTPDLA